MFALAGCTGDDPPRPVDGDGTASGGGSLLVTTDFKTGEVVYIEGAEPEVRLRTVDGEPVAQLSGDRMKFTGLEPGTYLLEPALRPCHGMSCTDARTDSCERTVQVADHTARAHVEFRVGEPCTVRITGGD